MLRANEEEASVDDVEGSTGRSEDVVVSSTTSDGMSKCIEDRGKAFWKVTV